MIPTPGKWYKIAYGKEGGKRGYHGPALCLRKGNGGIEGEGTWVFRAPDQPDWQCSLSHLLFKPCDIKEEVDPEPTYDELKQRVIELEEENSHLYRTIRKMKIKENIYY